MTINLIKLKQKVGIFMKSLNIVFPEKNKVILLEEDIASPRNNEVLCTAQKSLISIGTETLCLKGIFDEGTNWKDWVQWPFHAGYSMSAKVVATGRDVENFKEGDRVAATTAHKQYFISNQNDLHLLPKDISYEEGTWMSLACTTQLGVRRADLKLGETVGVVGMGMLGQLVIQYLKLSGARKIIAIDPIKKRLDFAKIIGATHTLAIDINNAKKEIEDITKGKLLDVIYDVTGSPSVLAPCIQLVRKLGRVILLGDTTVPTQQYLGPGVVYNSISILGIHAFMYPLISTVYNPWTYKEMTSLFFDYIEQGRMNVKDLITHHFSPIDAPDVYSKLLIDRSDAIGVIFDWTLLK